MINPPWTKAFFFAAFLLLSGQFCSGTSAARFGTVFGTSAFCVAAPLQAAVAEEAPKPAAGKAQQQQPTPTDLPAGVGPDPASTRTPLERVTFDIQYLASDEMGGRQPGKPGIQLAEDYIVSQYKLAGLKTLENGTYLQEFQVGDSRTVDKEQTALSLQGPAGEIGLTEGDDFRQLLCRKDFDLDKELVFVGYGISAEEHNYDDYANIDVAGKIVVLIRREPQQDDPNSVFDGLNTSRHASARAKIVAARRNKAAGVLIVNDGYSASDEERDALMAADRFGSNSLPFAQIKRNVFDQVLAQSPLITPLGKKLKTLDEVESLLEKNLEPLSQPIIDWTAKFKSAFQLKTVSTNNIIGIIEGEGPNADETIVIGAHYDHLGNGAYGSRAAGRKEIHNGADDNATGTAAVMELARRFAASEKPPGRRLVFICFSAEEMGLLGAYHYVDNPVVPLENTAVMINFDMIGWLREKELTLYGWDTSPQLSAVFDAANEGTGLELLKPAAGFGGSDHLPFQYRQIPNTFIHTGLNPVYHTPEDDFEAINCEGAVLVIDFSEKAIEGLANLKSKPIFGTPKPFRLGVMLSDKNDIVTVEGVQPDSIAQRAGIEKGDIIFEVDGDKLTKRRHLTRLIRKEKGNLIQLKLKRGDEVVTLDVLLKEVDASEDDE